MGFGQEFVIFALDNLIALFVYFIFFPMLLCSQICFLAEIGGVELIDKLRTEKIEYGNNDDSRQYTEQRIEESYFRTYFHVRIDRVDNVQAFMIYPNPTTV